MSHTLAKFPLIRVLLAYILGIILFQIGIFDQIPTYLFWTICITTLSVSIVLLGISSYMHGVFRGLLIFLFFIFMGPIILRVHDDSLKTDYVRNTINKSKYFYGIVIAEPEQKEKSIKVRIRIVNSIDSNKTIKRASGEILCYLSKPENSESISYGDYLIFRNKLREIPPPANPYQFNYKRFAKQRGIEFQCFLTHEHYDLSGLSKKNPIYEFTFQIRNKIKSQLARNGLEGKEFAVANAILLGQKDFLDKETRNQFSGAGAMHILCVSGLHVGVLYLALGLILSSFFKGKRTKLAKTIIILTIIWLYAAISGFSPSISRAAFMFSFIESARLIKRKSSIFQSISLSAFILLIINPNMLFYVGFQLSYLAVLGIVIIYPFLRKTFYSKYKIPDYFIQIMLVSVAAQLATAPLSIYYFNQFPTYFMLTNLIIIPLSFIIICLGFGFIILSAIPYVNLAIGYGLGMLIKFMNNSVEFIHSLNGSVIQGIHLSWLETILLYFLIVFVFEIVSKKKKSYFVFTFIIICCLSSLKLHAQFIYKRSTEIIVYSIRGHSAYLLRSGMNSYAILDDELLKNDKKKEFNLNPHWIRLPKPPKIISMEEDVESAEFTKQGNKILFCNYKLLLLDVYPESSNKEHSCNILIFNNIRLDNSVEIKKQDELISIYDSSCKYYKNPKSYHKSAEIEESAYFAKDQFYSINLKKLKQD